MSTRWKTAETMLSVLTLVNSSLVVIQNDQYYQKQQICQEVWYKWVTRWWHVILMMWSISACIIAVEKFRKCQRRMSNEARIKECHDIIQYRLMLIAHI